MSLRDALHTFHSTQRQPLPELSLAALIQVADQLAEMTERLERIPTLVPTPLVLDDVVEALRAGTEPEYRALKRVCQGGLDPLLAYPDARALLRALLQCVQDSGRAMLHKALFTGFLQTYQSGHWLTWVLTLYFRQNFVLLPRIWQARVARYGLLADDCARTLARMLLEQRQRPVHDLLDDMGVRGLLRHSGFAISLYRAVCDQVFTQYPHAPLDRFWQVIAPGGLPYEHDPGATAHALLSPYFSQDPDAATREQIEKFLLLAYGDPRLSSQAWLGVPREATGIFSRWLTQHALDVLTQIVENLHEPEQWAERYRFWHGLIQHGVVSDVWIALGPAAYKTLEHLQQLGRVMTNLPLGALTQGGADSTHSVLLMRVGDYIVTDWTHSGKIRIYEPDNPQTPVFYQTSYDPAILRNDEHADHIVPHHTGWPSKVEWILFNLLGVPRPLGSVHGSAVSSLVVEPGITDLLADSPFAR